jgi:GNAT superfamily N-acetyltransferase
MTPADVPLAHALSVQFKWPHRLEEWAMLQRIAQGFVVEDGGHLIGTSFTCAQGDYATIGLVIVSDEYQGQGIGRKLMELALEACGSRTAMLNATLAGAPLYASQGFIDFGHIQQHQGHALSPVPNDLPAGERCRPLTKADRSDQIELANAGSGLNRHAVLNDLFDSVEHSVGIEREGQLRAFAMLRPFGRGRCIGPVIAQSPEQAKHLIAVLLAQVPDAFVRMDIPSDSGLAPWLEEAGLKQVDTVAQMARGTPPQAIGGVRQFALVTQAIG